MRAATNVAVAIHGNRGGTVVVEKWRIEIVPDDDFIRADPSNFVVLVGPTLDTREDQLEAEVDAGADAEGRESGIAGPKSDLFDTCARTDETVNLSPS